MPHRIYLRCFSSLRLRFYAVLLALIALPAPAHAGFGDYGEGGWGISSSTLQDMIRADMMNRSLRQLQDAVHGDDGEARPKAPPRSPLDVSYSVSSSGKSFSNDRGVVRLAALFPREEFIRRKNQISKGVLALDAQVVKVYGVPRFNLATARAAAIAGAYAAYHGRSFPDEQVKPLVSQLERLLERDEAVLSASTRSRAYQYQLNMGLGLLLMGAELELRAKPDAAQAEQLKAIGAATLETIFGVEASRIEFGPEGYVIR